MIRSLLEKKLNAIWYGGQPPGLLLRALSSGYARVVSGRQPRQSLAPDLEDRPIVVVGNITAGGTGKTPLVIRLCTLLQSAGYVAAVVSRGYGRSSGKLTRVRAGDSARAVGDEPRLIADRTGLEVIVGPNRRDAARLAFAHGAEIVISDDGLQRADFPRSYEICVVDGQRGLGNGRLLPAGPLREPPERLQTVDAVVVNGADTLPGMNRATVPMRLEPGDMTRLDNGQRRSLAKWCTETGDKPLVAVAGIGNPLRFFAQLEALGLTFETRAFPDHHTYTAADFAGLREHRIVMTEKDAVKCGELSLADAWFLPVAARLPEAWEAEFIAAVTAPLRARERG